MVANYEVGQVLNTQITKIWLEEDGILRLWYKPDAVNTMPEAIEIMEALNQAKMGQKRPLLSDIRNLKRIDLKSRLYGAKQADIVCALAVIVDSSLTRTIHNIFIRLGRPAYPTKSFDNETEPLDWLEQYSNCE